MPLAMHLSRIFKPQPQNVPSMPQNWALLVMLSSSLPRLFGPREQLSLLSLVVQHNKAGCLLVGRSGNKMSVLPSPRTGYTVRQHNQTCFPYHVNEFVSPGNSDPVEFGDLGRTARRGKHSSVCRPIDNDKFFPHYPIGAKRTCNPEHDLSCHYDGDHRRRTCGIAPADIRHYAPTPTSVLAFPTSSATTTSSDFSVASKKGVPSHTTVLFSNAMPLRLNKTSLAPKVPQLGDQPDDTVPKVRETLAPNLQALGLQRGIDVVSFDGGDSNALYLVTFPESDPVLFRMSMDMTIENKVESEVATMEFVRRHTTIPVPRVYAYDSSCNNAVGPAFILLEYVKSVRYYDVQDDLTDGQQRDIGKHVAGRLCRLSFDKIGSLYLRDEGFVLGPLSMRQQSEVLA